MKKCNDPRCLNCAYLIEGTSIVMENGELVHVRREMTCKTLNVIYVIFCQGCGRSYIGQTGRRFNERATGHRGRLFNSIHRQEVYRHINECIGCDRMGPPSFRVFPFFKLPADSTAKNRINWEMYFIQRYGSSLNAGRSGSRFRW